MDIDIAINLLQGLDQFLDEFREEGFASSMNEAKQMASEMGIEPKFQEKRIIRRKKQFDESDNDNVTRSSEESFRVEYFLFIIDQARSSLQVRFEQFKQYQEIFGFLLNLEKLKSEPLTSLMKSCMELQQFLSHDGRSDINGDELCSELMVVRCYLTNEKRAIDMLQSLAKLNGLFPNTYIAYKILLTIPVTVASAERRPFFIFASGLVKDRYGSAPNPSANSPSLHSRPPMLSAAFSTSLFARPTPRGRLDNRTPISCLPHRIYPPPIRSCNGRRNFLVSISRSLCCSTGSRVARSPVASGLDSDTRAMPSSDQRVPVLELVRSRGFRSVLAVIACGLLAANCGRVLAAEGVAESGILAFGSKKAVFSGSWPKLLQVLGVLREQGLFLAALLGISAFFSMAETSITTLWPWKVRELAEKDPENGVFRMLQSDVTRFLTTILIGTTVVNIGATALVTDAATAIFGEAGISAATGVMTVAILLLTEITPKSIAVHNAAEVARFVVRPVAWLSVVLYPVGRITTFLSMGMLKMLGLKGRSEPYVTEDELKLMLRGAELSGAIEEEEQDMIENVLEIKDTHVKEVMTPLVDVIAIDASAKLADFKNLWETYQYSRVPVFQDRIDNIVGIAYAMDMLEYVEKADHLKDSTVREIAHMPTYFIPERGRTGAVRDGFPREYPNSSGISEGQLCGAAVQPFQNFAPY
ncbi:putative DUF21 domain-containing protein At3g13070, chloroplastic [Zingiber officinale]|uniref:putative DUF21 domain-containing protein At3g13070, chloroplastic n=1 Tax=Zingiber officinale TaxID=94328 RepID=UPI001C4C6624|nr:putative DUF21 domain-containing protein At3g13070, chloroplastic [Zingiber officinale]